MVPESVLGYRRLLLGGLVAYRYRVTVSGQQHWLAWATEPSISSTRPRLDRARRAGTRPPRNAARTRAHRPHRISL